MCCFSNFGKSQVRHLIVSLNARDGCIELYCILLILICSDCFYLASVHPNRSLRGVNCGAALEWAVQKAASEVVVLKSVQDLARQSHGWSDPDVVLVLAFSLWEVGLEAFTAHLWPTVLWVFSDWFLLVFFFFFPCTSFIFFMLLWMLLNTTSYCMFWLLPGFQYVILLSLALPFPMSSD